MTAEQLQKLIDNIPLVIRAAVQESRVLIQGLVGLQMGERAVTDAYRAGGNNPFDSSTRRNPGSKLRIATGRLFRSFGQSAPEGIFTINASGGIVDLTIGTKVPYASIHEHGGTIQHPGGTPYIVTRDGIVFIRRSTADRLRSAGRTVRVTRPHSITIRARPFLKPAMQAFAQRQDFLTILDRRIKELLTS